MLQNMKIKKSLILGFAITIGLSLAIIFATLTMINLQRGAYHEILDYNVRANELVSTCRVNANTAARNVRDIALRPTDSGNAALQKRAEEVLDTMNQDLEELKKIYPLTDKQLLNDYVNGWRNGKRCFRAFSTPSTPDGAMTRPVSSRPSVRPAWTPWLL